LVAPRHLTQLSWKREGEQKVWDWQQGFFLNLEPGLGLFVLAFGAMPIAARVIAVLKFLAGNTAIHLSTEYLRPAMLNGPHRLAMAGQ
jgi:hypothetical protein